MVLNWLTILLLVYLLLGALEGMRRGFLLVVFSLAGYVAGVLVAVHYQARITGLLVASLPVRQWIVHFVPTAVHDRVTYTASFNLFHTVLGLVVFLIMVGLAEALFRAAGQALTNILARGRITGTLNRLGGMAGGILENALLIGIVLGIVTALPLLAGSPVSRLIQHTPLAADLVRWVGTFAHWRAERWLA